MNYRGVDPEKLAEFIENSGLKPRNGRQSFIFTCPKCMKEEKLWMFRETGQFVCWYCKDLNGFKGKPEYALAPMLNRSVASIQKELYGSELASADLFFDLELVNWWSDDEAVDEVPDMNTISRVLWSPDYYPIEHKFSVKGLEYLQSRGINLELAQYYGIRYCPIDKRVAFPVAYQGALFGWQGRYIGPTEWIDPETSQERSIIKILSSNSLSGQRDRVVQFGDQLIGTDQAIICEGPIDAIKCHLCRPSPDNLAGNIATMGKAVSEQQIALLKYSGIKRVYLALDPDAEAEVGRLTKAFEPDIEVYLMKVPSPHKDFGEMTPEAVYVAYKEAKRINPGQMFFYLKPIEELMWKKRRL